MEIRINNDSVDIEGYVNAVERKSKPLWSRIGQFVERIRKGAFKRAIERNDNIRIMLNHTKDLGGTKEGNLELKEDNIGLFARATITDKEVIEKARNDELVGWSFGFYDREVDQRTDEDGFPLRNVIDLDLEEVSILDNTTTPAYDGTLVAVRSDESSLFFSESFRDEIHLRETDENDKNVPKQQETVEEDINYEQYETLIEDMKK